MVAMSDLVCGAALGVQSRQLVGLSQHYLDSQLNRQTVSQAASQAER